MRNAWIGSPLLAALFLIPAAAPLLAQQPTWVQKSPNTVPMARRMHAIAYDEFRQKIVMYGGMIGSSTNPDPFWLWDGVNWTSPNPANSPGRGYSAAMAYDAARGEIVLYGGWFSGQVSAKTWVWNGADWTERRPAHTPPALVSAAMAYDAARRQIVLFGGKDFAGFDLSETWVWDGVDWTKKNPSATPPMRSEHGLSYDSVRSEVVLFGGLGGTIYLGDTWVWDGANWSPRQSGFARSRFAMSFDPRLGKTILFGSQAPGGDTLAWDGASWARLAPPQTPPPLMGTAMAYDAARGEMILFGGARSAAESSNSTWAWVVPTSSQNTLQLSPSSLTFDRMPPGPEPQPQTIAVTTPGAPSAFSVTSSTADGGNWLRVTPTSGTTPANLTVSIDSAGLLPGYYNGTIAVSAAGSVNSPQKAVVQFQVRPSGFVLQPSSLSFQSLAGSTTPITSQVQVGTMVPGQAPFTATSSQPWLTVTPVAGVSPATLNVTVQPASLTVGTHIAEIRVTSTTGQLDWAVVQALVYIDQLPRLSITPATILVPAASNGGPQKRTLQVSTTAPSATVRAEVLPGSPWLTVDPPTGIAAPNLTVNLTFNPAGLADGAYYGTVVISTPNSTQASVAASVAMQVTTPRGILSQVADGSDWQTSITLVNLGSTPASSTLRFYSQQGTPLVLPFESPTGNSSQVQSLIPANGTVVIRTTGSSTALLQGWAELETSGDVSGVGIFRQRAEGRPDREAAVAITTPSNRSLLPFDNQNGHTTSLALVNTKPIAQDSMVVTARSEQGQTLLTAPIVLPIRGQIAVASQSQFPAITGVRGVLDLSAGAFTGLGLRFDPAGPFTSFPLMPIPTQPVQNQVLSQLADGGAGGDWQTSITLVNLDSQPAPYTLRFWAPTGQPLFVPIAGLPNTVQSLQDTIPAGGVQTIATLGNATPLIQGWTELVSTRAIGGLAVFRQRANGLTGNEAVVTSAAASQNLVLPFDNTGNALTSIALVNANPGLSATLAIGLYDEAGGLFGSELLQLSPRGQIAFLSTDRIPALRNRRGILRISSPGGSISGLALRFNSTGAFTTIPVFSR